MKAILFTFVCLTFLFTLPCTGQYSYDVKFKSGTVSPLANIESYDAVNQIRSEEIVDGRIHRYLQFAAPLTQSDITRLNDQGVKLLSYIPNLTYIVSLPSEISSSDLTKMNARSIWSIDLESRAHADVLSQSLPDWSIAGSDALLTVQYYRDLDGDEVVNTLIAKGIKINGYNGVNNYISISLPLDQMQSLLEIPHVAYVYPMPPPPVKEDRRGRSLHRVNKLNPNYAGARNYSGSGINVLVRDDGALFEHPDFRGRMDQTFVGENRGDHGDGVGGIMAGAGNLDPINRGMAHGSTMYVTDYEATFLDETMSLFANQDVIVTNSSYSNGCNNGYTFITEIVDQQVYDNPTLAHIFSAGNNGQGTLNNNDELVECGYGAGLVWGNVTGGHKIGKNVIATANLNYRGEIMPSSSRGPSADGRLKPDISANGNNHVSTAEGNSYRAFGGTSGAAPVVAGVTAMLHEAYHNIYDERATSALLKAIVMNTANDLGNVGPDFIYGWGNLNAHRAALAIEEGRFLKATVAQGEANQHTITIPDNVKEMKVMTYWSDPQASPNSANTLVNDLNTQITDANNVAHLPWELDPTADPAILNSPAIKGFDDRNNVEQVAINDPAAGVYVLTVDGTQIPFGTSEYYVVWEYQTDAIDIIFPDGGENLNENSNEVVHWDAVGTDGEFEITLITGSGEEIPVVTVGGASRLYEWRTPDGIDEGAKLRISRNGVSAESTETFLIADNPENVGRDNDSIGMLRWEGVEEAVSYNIYALGDKYMEYQISSIADSFLLPDAPIYKDNWVAITAVFPDGKESKRSLAATTSVRPTAVATNDQDDEPCVGQPVVFDSQTEGSNLSYSWNFGSNSDPSEADTKGPHTVIYSKKGNSLAAVNVSNDAGFNEAFFVMRIKDQPKDGDNTITELGSGAFAFSTKVTLADTYTWDFGDGNTAEGKDVEHTYTVAGVYDVILTAQNKCGAQIKTESLTVGDPTAVEDLLLSSFAIGPNPSLGDLSLTLPDLEGHDLIVEIVAVDGKLVDQKSVANPIIGQRIEWKELGAGTYVVHLKFGGHQLSETVIVR